MCGAGSGVLTGSFYAWLLLLWLLLLLLIWGLSGLFLDSLWMLFPSSGIDFNIWLWDVGASQCLEHSFCVLPLWIVV